MHRQEKVIIKGIIEKFCKLKKLIKLSDEIAQVLHKVLHKIDKRTHTQTYSLDFLKIPKIKKNNFYKHPGGENNTKQKALKGQTGYFMLIEIYSIMIIHVS